MPVKYTKVWADFFPKNFGGCQVTWNEWVSIVLLRYLLFFFYVMSVWFGLCSSPVVSAVSLYLVESVVLTWSKKILCSCYSCSVIRYPLLWLPCKYSDSQQFINLPFLHASTNSIIRFCSPYSCILSRICSAYADWGLFVRIYLICSLYLAYVELLVWPMYTPWHVLKVSL